MKELVSSDGEMIAGEGDGQERDTAVFSTDD
jgi:hypothetical protein